MKKYVPFEKQSKKAQREARKAQRVLVGFNTGDRIHADKRRKAEKKSWKDEISY